MVYWQKFNPAEFEFNLMKPNLPDTRLALMKPLRLFWNGFQVRRNKRYHGGYQIIGYTDGGRELKLIVYEKRKGLIRVITGWDCDD